MDQSTNTRMHRLRLEVEALAAEAHGRQDEARNSETREYWRGRGEVCEVLLNKIDRYLED